MADPTGLVKDEHEEYGQLRKDQLFAALRWIGEVIIADLGLLIASAASFLFTKGFTFQAYSDRLLWAGMAATLLGGAGGLLGGMGSAVARYRRWMEQGESVEEKAKPSRYALAPHHRFAFRLWAIGALCIAASVLIGALLSRGS